MASVSLSERRRREAEELTAAYRVQGCPYHEIAAEIAASAGITPLWVWRLAKGWCRGDVLERLRQLGDFSVDESMLWRWETGEREPSRRHLDRLCRVYQTRPDLLGYGRDYSQQPAVAANGPTRNPTSGFGQASATAVMLEAPRAEPLAMMEALTVSEASPQVVEFLERAAERLQGASAADGGPTQAASLGDLALQYRMVVAALRRRQRDAGRRRLARVAAARWVARAGAVGAGRAGCLGLLRRRGGRDRGGGRPRSTRGWPRAGPAGPASARDLDEQSRTPC